MKLEIAKALINSGCVKLSPSKPFTYASGLKGPIYCDNRLILSHVEFRNAVIDKFIEMIKNKSLKFDLIGGIATAGIPSAAIIADRIQRPLIYVRPKPKGHGKMNQVEGAYKVNQSVLLIEDLVNQGSSLVDAHKGIVEAGLISTECLCVVDYQMKDAKIKCAEVGINLLSLTNFENIIEAGVELKLISLEEKKILTKWHDDPKGWSKE